MGYTHYWTQTRDFDDVAFAEIGDDVAAILTHAVNQFGIAICDASAEPGTAPEITAAMIGFNGTDLDDLGHEGFLIERIRTPNPGCAMPLGWSYCKTDRKPYDRAVTAVLCYLATIVESFEVGSDGRGVDFLDGLALARAALPRHANRLDIPRPILAADRWCPPYVRMHTKAYEVCFCVDGHAYVIDAPTGIARYRFTSHAEASRWLETHEERARPGSPLFAPTGWTDTSRRAAIGRQQKRVLAALIASAAVEPAGLGRRAQPPALVRPQTLAAADGDRWAATGG